MTRNRVETFEMGRNLDPGGGTLIQAGSPRAKDFKTVISRNKEGGDLVTAQKVPGVHLPHMGDGVGAEDEVSARGADSLNSLCIPC